MRNFNSRVMSVFSSMNTNYDEMNNLMQDLALGKEIFDGERVISKAEANAKVLDFSRQILGITDINDKKAVRRALRDNGRDWFDIIEDTIDRTVSVAFKDNDWFTGIVDSRNIAFGDRADFLIENDGVLAVAKAGVSHHDHILQRVGADTVVPVPTSLYAVKVGADINKYVAGQVDWARFINAVSKAFIVKVQEEIFAEIQVASSSLPVTTGFIGNGTLSTATKANFDEIIENVSAANDGAPVAIFGTKSGLSKISALADVDWGADKQKDSVADTGNIGIYEGTALVTIPNRFKDSSLTTKIYNSNILLILPMVGEDGKFIKFVDEGDTIIVEKTDRGDYLSDIQTYEVQRKLGVATVIGRQFGQWTL